MKLYKHQEKVLDETKQFNRVAYYLDMGLGKTFVGSEKAMSFDKRILVVCQKSKIDDWIEHFKKYYPVTPFDLTNKKQYNEFFGTVGKCVAIINYDLIFRRKELLQLKDFTLMLDESSMITNPTAKRTKAIMKMNFANCILLSGTPTGGKYEKLWSQLHLLGWNITKQTFYQHYVITEWLEDSSGFKIPIVVGYKNVDRLKNKLREHGCIFMKTEEAFDLPEMVETPIMVKSSKVYHKFMKNSIVELDLMNLIEFHDDSDFWGKDVKPHITLIGDTSLTKRMYARQLCGQYNADKLKAFEDILQSTSDRLIVWYNFNTEKDILINIINRHKRPISIVNGDKKDLSAYEEYADSITLIQYKAGAMGLNLQKANKAVYFTLPQSSDLFEQSKKRIHRIGQNQPCFYYYLLCRNSVEGSIIDTLRLRKNYDDALFEAYEREVKQKWLS